MEGFRMKFSEIARVKIEKDSTLYESMLGCDLISRLQQGEIKAEDTYKRNKNIYTKRKVKGEKI
jgi:hypothetical protein